MNTQPKLLFFSSGAIAIPSLQMLLDKGYAICGVVTAPDRKKDRHLHIASTPVKKFALKNNLDIFQPDKLTSKDTLGRLKSFDADIFIVFAYGKILPKETLELPRMLPVNIHASLLPKYRGAAPINWALIHGETTTGVTIIRMNEKMDEGDIVFQKSIPIEQEDMVIQLENKLSIVAADALKQSLEDIQGNRMVFHKQDSCLASYAPKLKKENGAIDWQKKSHEIVNLFRGCYGWPGTFTFFHNTLLKIWGIKAIDKQREASVAPGTIAALGKEGIVVAAADTHILITDLQISSGKRLDAWGFLQGHPLKVGQILG